MKLYATVESERAKKGQGGNKYIRIELKDEKKLTRYYIDYGENGLLVMNSVYLSIFEDGEWTKKNDKKPNN